MSNLLKFGKIFKRAKAVSYAMTINKEVEILNALKTGNYNQAITAFVREYQNFVFNTAFRFLNSIEDAEDISQEVFIKAAEAIRNFRGESSIKTWLYRITKNYCLNYIRKQKVRKVFSFFTDISEDKGNTYKDNAALPDDLIESSELELKFLKAINKLPTKQRETFALRYFDEMPYSEIATILGTTVGGLKANYYQAVKKLAIELDEFKN